MGSTPTISSASTAPAPCAGILETRTRALFDVLIEREEQQGPPAVTPEQLAALEARLKQPGGDRSPTRRAGALQPGAARDAVGEEPQARQGAGPAQRAAAGRPLPASAATTPSSTGACASGPTSGPVSAACRGRPCPGQRPRPQQRAVRADGVHAAARGAAGGRARQPSRGCWRAAARRWPSSTLDLAPAATTQGGPARPARRRHPP